MRTIIVDDEPVMIRSFQRMAAGIEKLEILKTFSRPEEALEYAKKETIDLAVLDVQMPRMSGLVLANELRLLKPDILIVFVTAFTHYIGEANDLGADDYIVKPYKKETIEKMAERMSLLCRRKDKSVYIRTCGDFAVIKDGAIVPLRGNGKEILALIVSRRGKEISNEEIYSTIWEDREYGNVEMKVYYNALKRLRQSLEKVGLENILISTARGKCVNTALFDCDYYQWSDGELIISPADEKQFFQGYKWQQELLEK